MKRLVLSLLMAGTLAACSDGPTAAPDTQDGMRIVNIYSEADFARAGITAPSVTDIVARFGRARVNAVGRLDGSGVASLQQYCELQQPVAAKAAPAEGAAGGGISGEGVSNLYYNDCPDRPIDCFSNPYGYGCGDPCNWDSSLPECQPIDPGPVGPTPTGAVAQFSYGSSASGPIWVNRGGILLKEVTLTSWSQAIANVASTSLSASFRNVGAESGYGCGNASQQFDSSYSSGSGSPLLLQASRVANYLGTIKWEVTGTHSFTPVSGATGGGTFYSSNFVCG
jgi:hypothetical protein